MKETRELVTSRLTVEAALPPATPLDAGTLVARRYEIVDEIASGGMGVVHRALDRRLTRQVALKLLRSQDAPGGELEDRFLAEARAMALVNHENVIEIYDMGWHNARPYFVMELIEGATLDDWLDKQWGTPLAVDAALGIVDQVCKGVEAIRRAGTVHGDLKPSNVLLDANHRVAVADLGLVSFFDVLEASEHVAGTPGYMAPELLTRNFGEDAEMRARIDVYAVGAISYELLAGEAMFPQEDTTDVLHAQLAGIYQPLNDMRPELPLEFEDIIAKAVAVNPHDRWPSAENVRRGLREARRAILQRKHEVQLLIVDDDESSAGDLENYLENRIENAVFTRVPSHVAALEAAMERRPSLIITEHGRPGIDGAQLVDVLRAQAQFNHVPIVVVTSCGGAADWHRMRAAGADGFLVKPIDELLLGTLVDSLLEKPLRARAR
jgi:serine/threonine-protein kinase